MKLEKEYEIVKVEKTGGQYRVNLRPVERRKIEVKPDLDELEKTEEGMFVVRMVRAMQAMQLLGFAPQKPPMETGPAFWDDEIEVVFDYPVGLKVGDTAMLTLEVENNGG